MAMFVYVPKVSTIIRDDNCTVNVHKDVVKYKVIRSARQYMYLNPWAANAGGDEIKVDVGLCFTELEDAKALCNKMAEAKVQQLQLAIKELQKSEINVLDDFKRHDEFMKSLDKPKPPALESTPAEDKGNG